MIRLTQLLWLVMLTACGASLDVPEPATSKRAEWVLVPFPPPPVRPELVPQQPDHASLWIDGEWRWRTARWSWLDGRWVKPPPSAVGFARWRMERNDDGSLRYAVGTWVSHTGHRLPAQTANARDGAREGDVVEEIGTLEDAGRHRQARLPADDSPDDGPCDRGCPFDDGNPR
jgi:hypothetical protein